MSSGTWRPFCLGLNVLSNQSLQKYNVDLVMYKYSSLPWAEILSLFNETHISE